MWVAARSIIVVIFFVHPSSSWWRFEFFLLLLLFLHESFFFFFSKKSYFRSSSSTKRQFYRTRTKPFGLKVSSPSWLFLLFFFLTFWKPFSYLLLLFLHESFNFFEVFYVEDGFSVHLLLLHEGLNLFYFVVLLLHASFFFVYPSPSLWRFYFYFFLLFFCWRWYLRVLVFFESRVHISLLLRERLDFFTSFELTLCHRGFVVVES